MKKARFSEEQMVKLLREADQTPVIEVAKKQGISDATIYAWRKRYGQPAPVDVKRLHPRSQAVFEIRAQPDLVRDHGLRMRSGRLRS
jgi:putative transposase